MTDTMTLEQVRDSLREVGLNAGNDYKRAWAYELADAIDAAIKQREQQAKVSAFSWQPIETAPKDNKRPLFLARFNDDRTLQSFDYDAIWTSESESWEILEVYFFWASANGNVEEPTHWAYQPAWFDKIDAAMAGESGMNDLDTLRTEVREAIAYCDGIFDDADNGEWAIIRAELLRLDKINRILEIKNAGTLANNLCPDHRDKQTFRPCLACLLEKAEAELAAIKARIAEAPLVEIANIGDPFIVLPDHFTVPNSLKGKTVRLLVEE